MSITSRIILCVDDDEDDKLLVCEVIKKLYPSCVVKCASNGQEGLNLLNELKLRNELPDLIILDYNMPIMDGSATLQEIRKRPEFKDVPVVIYTTSRFEHTREFAELFGARMVTKAISYSQVERQVKEMLEFAGIV